jgi:hypothetical protein
MVKIVGMQTKNKMYIANKIEENNVGRAESIIKSAIGSKNTKRNMVKKVPDAAIRLIMKR